MIPKALILGVWMGKQIRYPRRDKKTCGSIWDGLLFSQLNVHQDYLEDLLQHKFLGPTFNIFDSVGLEWGVKICISSKFPGDSCPAYSDTALEEPLLERDGERTEGVWSRERERATLRGKKLKGTLNDDNDEC